MFAEAARKVDKFSPVIVSRSFPGVEKKNKCLVFTYGLFLPLLLGKLHVFDVP